MSQANTTVTDARPAAPVQPAAPIPPASNSAFAKPPVHPYRQGSVEAASQPAQPVPSSSVSTPPATPATWQPAQVPPAQPGMNPGAPVAQPPAPAATQPRPTVSQPPAQSTPTAQPSAQSPTQPATPQPQWDTSRYMSDQLNALAQERAQLYQAMQDKDRQITELTQAVGQYKRMQATQAQQEALSAAITESLSNTTLESIDEADAQRLVAATVAAVSGQLAAMQQQSEQRQQAYEARLAQHDHTAYQQQVERTRNEILAAHPDYPQFMYSPEYRAFLSERDGLSSETRYDRAVREFNAGNAAYMIDLFNQFKNRGVDVQAAASVVPPLETPSSYSNPVQTDAQPQLTYTQLFHLMQTHAITPEEFYSHLGQLRAKPA